MPDIGQTLRETRMRRRIDISEVEAETKIRARYLRALENEEWDLLPGPTFVKTFLRTYADYLGLDARPLVETYRQRYEKPGTQELTPFAPARSGRRPGGRGPRISPLGVVAVAFVVIVAGLFILGRSGEDEGGNKSNAPRATPTPTPRPSSSSSSKSKRKQSARRKSAARRQIRLQLVALQPVIVCLIDADGRKRVDGATLDPATPRRTYRSRSFRAWFANGAIELRVNGRAVDVPDRANPTAYTIHRSGDPLRPVRGNPAAPCR